MNQLETLESTKPKVVGKSKIKEVVDYLESTTPINDKIVEEVDIIIALDAKIEPVRPFIKQFEAHKKVVQSIAAGPEFSPDQTVVLHGSIGVVEFSSATSTLEISDKNGLIGALKAKIGYPALLELLNINLTDVKKYLSESELMEFYTPAKGARRLKSIQMIKDL